MSLKKARKAMKKALSIFFLTLIKIPPLKKLKKRTDRKDFNKEKRDCEKPRRIYDRSISVVVVLTSAADFEAAGTFLKISPFVRIVFTSDLTCVAVTAGLT